MNKNQIQKDIGAAGEKMAVSHLEKSGYLILDKNFRAGHGEIDIIAQKDNTIIFCEVKTKKFGDFGDPIHWVTKSKQRQIGKIALAYLLKKGYDSFEYRFDVITVTWIENSWRIDHIENAFWL